MFFHFLLLFIIVIGPHAQAQPQPQTYSYADDFDDGSSSTNLSGNDGSLDWTTDWSPDDSVSVVDFDDWCQSGHCLQLLADHQKISVVTSRQANLDGAVRATLSFGYRTYFHSDGGIAVVSVRAGSNVNYAALKSFNQNEEGSVTLEIHPRHLTSTFQLQFYVTGVGWNDFYIDNVKINVEGVPRSTGCGQNANTGHGYFDIYSANEDRKYYLSVPLDYDPNESYPLVIAYHGLNYDGKRMRDYLRLEQADDNIRAIFAYPDGKARDWPWYANFSDSIGWMTGQSETNQDFLFFDDMLDDIADKHCIDLTRVYVTGQSWGGDMASSISCARGKKIAASVSVAANDAHFFEGLWKFPHDFPPIEPWDCQKPVAMITMKGADDVFDPAPISNWWYQINQCQAGFEEKKDIIDEGTYDDVGCVEPNIFVIYNNESPPYYTDNDHEIPIDYEFVTMSFFSQHVLPA